MHYVCILSNFLIYVNVHGCSHKKPTLTGHFRERSPSVAVVFFRDNDDNKFDVVRSLLYYHDAMQCMPACLYTYIAVKSHTR